MEALQPLEVNSLEAFASLDEEILELSIIESEDSSSHTKKRCIESKMFCYVGFV